MATIPEHEPFIQSIRKEWYGGKVAAVDMLRLDVVHKVVSGNKWYKLKHNIENCLTGGYKHIFTFGGGYSNHLVATAAAANMFGLRSTGIIRGDYSNDRLTPTLKSCMDYGMDLRFVTREEYNQKNDDAWLEELTKNYGGAYIVPEGGANEDGRKGAEDIGKMIPEGYTHIAVSVGTGTTLAGICNAVGNEVTIYGYASMKGGAYLQDELRSYIKPEMQGSYTIFDNWHFGGFGRSNDELIRFMNEFYEINDIPLDVVYTGKMMYGLLQQINEGVFDASVRIMTVHTGGLQGNVSIQDKLLYNNL